LLMQTELHGCGEWDRMDQQRKQLLRAGHGQFAKLDRSRGRALRMRRPINAATIVPETATTAV
jgi:hypothetical protein